MIGLVEGKQLPMLKASGSLPRLANRQGEGASVLWGRAEWDGLEGDPAKAT